MQTKNSNQKPVVLVVGQTPPPIHGQAVMIQEFLRGAYQSFELKYVPMAFSKSIDDTGSFRAGKVFEMFRVIAGIVQARFRGGAEILYYPPSGFAMSGVLRDLVILNLARPLFRRTVFHLHAGGLTDRRNRLPGALRWLFDRGLGSPDLAIAVSSATLADAQCLHPKRALTVYNGIADTPAKTTTSPANDEVARLLYMGSLREDKGVMVLLEAARLLRDGGCPFHLALAGGFASEAFRQEVHKYIDAQRLHARVRLCGVVQGEGKRELLAQSDIFCFPSHYSAENFPLVLLEAMSFGLPIVATDWRGIPEAVNHRNGLLVPIRNPQAVADRLAYLIQNKQERIRMGRNGRDRYLAEFTLDAFRAHMEDAIGSMAGGRAA